MRSHLNSKLYLGKACTEKQINKLSAEKVDKLFSNYEAKPSGQMVASGFECTFPLFRTRIYIKWYHLLPTLRTYGQSSSAACFDQHPDSEEKPKVGMKRKSNCAPDGSVMLANGFPSRIVIIACWYSTGICSNYIL